MFDAQVLNRPNCTLHNKIFKLPLYLGLDISGVLASTPQSVALVIELYSDVKVPKPRKDSRYPVPAGGTGHVRSILWSMATLCQTPSCSRLFDILDWSHLR